MFREYHFLHVKEVLQNLLVSNRFLGVIVNCSLLGEHDKKIQLDCKLVYIHVIEHLLNTFIYLNTCIKCGLLS